MKGPLDLAKFSTAIICYFHVLGANFVDKQYPIHDFCSSLSALRALIPKT